MIVKRISTWLVLLLLLGVSAPLAADDDGAKDLDDAIELKDNAKSLRDLDSVVDLCESALKKGLDEQSTILANAMIKSTLLQHAKQLGERIFQPRRDSRWRIFRREALLRLDRALELDEKLVDAYILKARLLLLDGKDKDKATAAIDKAIEFAGDDKPQLSLALLMRAAVSGDEAARVSDLNQAIKVNPGNVQARIVRGRYFFENQKFDKAIEDFKALADNDQANIQIYLLLIQSLIRVDQTDSALEYIDQAIELEPRASDVYTMRAQIMLMREKIDDAFEDCERAIKLNPRDYTAHFFEAAIHFEKNENEAALKAVDKALVFQPGFERAIEMRGSILVGLKRYDEAISEVKKLAEFDPDQVRYRIQMGMIHNAADRPQAALKIYDEILEEDPQNADALRGRGDAFLTAGDHKKAIEDYEAILEIREDDSGTLNNLAWVLATSPIDELRDGKRSVELGLKACELTEYKPAHILSTLAAGYAESGDFENAKKWAAKAVAAGEEQNSDTLENLKKELASYEANKPWRELLEKKDVQPNNGGGSIEVDDDKKSDSADKKEAKDDKSTEGKSEEKGEAGDKKADDNKAESEKGEGGESAPKEGQQPQEAEGGGTP